jgi:hypothetical protein
LLLRVEIDEALAESAAVVAGRDAQAAGGVDRRGNGSLRGVADVDLFEDALGMTGRLGDPIEVADVGKLINVDDGPDSPSENDIVFATPNRVT